MLYRLMVLPIISSEIPLLYAFAVSQVVIPFVYAAYSSRDAWVECISLLFYPLGSAANCTILLLLQYTTEASWNHRTPMFPG